MLAFSATLQNRRGRIGQRCVHLLHVHGIYLRLGKRRRVGERVGEVAGIVSRAFDHSCLGGAVICRGTAGSARGVEVVVCDLPMLGLGEKVVCKVVGLAICADFPLWSLTTNRQTSKRPIRICVPSQLQFSSPTISE